MSKKIKSPFSRASIRSIRQIREIVEQHRNWRASYLRGEAVQVHYLRFSELFGDVDEKRAATIMVPRTMAWLETNRTPELDKANALYNLRVSNRAAYETYMLRKAVEAGECVCAAKPA